MRARLFLALLALLTGTFAGAVEVKLLQSDRLEVRPITLPDGSTSDLYVITGSPVRLEVDGDRITAEYLEFDEASGLLRIVGPGDVAYGGVVTKGEDYVIDLSSEELSVQDVFIFTEPLDIRGVEATRQPGQLDITSGAFSPCSRCDQPVQDYRFRADRLRLYPGDRLVAFDVTVFVRGVPLFVLPIMVVPLGPEERRPRFSVTQGSNENDYRAAVALDWPYVVGANAFGTLALRYYAEVTPGVSSGLAEGLLGGRIDESYLGGGFDHRFYTDTGSGEFEFFYTPPFADDRETLGETSAEFNLLFRYETQEALDIPQWGVLIENDDASSPRITEYTARYSRSYGGFDVAYATQGYFDLRPDDDTLLPSYSEPEGSLRTYSELALSPAGEASFSVGPFTLSELLLDVGAFQDYANPGNPSALASPVLVGGTPVVSAGRLLESHTLTLAPITPFAGFSLSGSTAFTGQYYTTGERFVDWDTLLNAEQDFGVGSLSLEFGRNVTEGETPFSFDAVSALDSSTYLITALELAPLEWLEVAVEESYVFVDNRNLDDLGPGPLEARVELFDNLEWVGLSLEGSYDLEENDPGLLEVDFGLVSPDDVVTGSLRYEALVDLQYTPDRVTGARVNDSETTLEADLGYSSFLSFDFAAGYDFNGFADPFSDDYGYDYPEEDGEIDDDVGEGDEDDEDLAGRPRWKPLELGLTVGTLEQDDAPPGLRLSYARDLNLGVMEAVGIGASTRLGPVELEAEQRFDFLGGSADDSLFQITWPGVASLSATGFTLLPPSLVGLELGPEASASYSLSLADETRDESLYEFTYSTTYGPLFEEGFGFSGSSLEASVDLPYSYLGGVGVGVELAAQLLIADDENPLTYLSSGALTLASDFYSRVGVQGSLAYSASYDDVSGTFYDSDLGFSEFGVTVKVLDDLYLSALLTDVWDFSGNDPTQSPFNLQPILYLTLDRCCWALYGALDTRDGTLSVTLGYPGSDQGFPAAFNTPLALPGREWE